jgi:hypothetical protein
MEILSFNIRRCAAADARKLKNLYDNQCAQEGKAELENLPKRLATSGAVEMRTKLDSIPAENY